MIPCQASLFFGTSLFSRVAPSAAEIRQKVLVGSLMITSINVFEMLSGMPVGYMLRYAGIPLYFLRSYDGKAAAVKLI